MICIHGHVFESVARRGKAVDLSPVARRAIIVGNNSAYRVIRTALALILGRRSLTSLLAVSQSCSFRGVPVFLKDSLTCVRTSSYIRVN
jgi:hypothetical protein